MSLIRLEFEVDSDVYPELHAMLTTIVNSASRGERVRQLAACGLVWERFRAQGQLPPESQLPVARVNVVAAPVEVTAPAPAERAAPALDERAAPAPLPLPAAAKSKPRTAKKRAANAAGPSDFVDLAIDAKPAVVLDDPPPLLPPAPRPPERTRGKPPRDLPVLRDVVDPSASSRWMDSAAGELADTAPAPFSEASLALHAEATGSSHDDGAISPVPQGSGTRSRLMRMKEKGLFKNG